VSDIGQPVVKIHHDVSRDDSLSASDFVDVHAEQGHHELRSRLQLNGLQVVQPKRDDIENSETTVHAPRSADSWDYIG